MKFHRLTEEQKNVIMEARERGLVTYSSIAKKVDVSPPSIVSWLKGERRIQRSRDWKAMNVECARLREELADSKTPAEKNQPPFSLSAVGGAYHHLQSTVGGLKSWMQRLDRRLQLLERKQSEKELEEVGRELSSEEK